jgi:hypothetical protein
MVDRDGKNQIRKNHKLLSWILKDVASAFLHSLKKAI